MDGAEVVGTFRPEAFFETLALILSRKYGANITVKVTRPDDGAGRAGEGGTHGGTRIEALPVVRGNR